MILLYTLILYVLLLKVLPFVLYPNYLRSGKVERYPALVELSEKLRSKDRQETLRNAFAYLREHHASDGRIWKWKNLATLLLAGDFSTEPYIDKDCFLWCHTQNRLLKSLLVNSGHFREDEVRIGRMFFRNHNSPAFGLSIFIHQYVLVDLDDRTTVKVDPFYGILEER
ncbi:MAG: hypothetical protein HGB34_03245 [Candidatus Moranbacteria bacterium]|nr:hypothetical protein [Candidatus Moranbacteria bacterium]